MAEIEGLLPGYRLAVVGTRWFDDFDTLVKILDRLRLVLQIDVIISGGAEGVDSMAEHYAKVNGIPTEIYLAEWDKYGKGAGFRRNKTIWDNSDIFLVIWDGESKGTAHSFDIAKKQGKDLYVYNYKENKFWKN